MNQISNEKDLIKLATKDKDAFAKLYEIYANRIHTYLRSRLNGDELLADDITSITFEKALKNLKSFKWQGVSFSAWLYKIANNSLIDYYRKQNSHKTTQLVHDNYSDKSENIEESAAKYDTDFRIKSVLSSLSENEREIIILKFYEGYTNKSIAEKIGLSETNIGTIIHRTMIKLRDLILSKGDIYM